MCKFNFVQKHKKHQIISLFTQNQQSSLRTSQQWLHIVGSPADPRQNFKQWNWVPFPLHEQPHLRRAPYPPVVHFNYRLARVRTWVQSGTVPVDFPGDFQARKEDSLWLPWSSSVGLRCERFVKSLVVKKSSWFSSPCQAVPVWTRWWIPYHVTGRLPLNHS